MTTISVLRNDAELPALAAEWQALWNRVPTATPFQSPAWLQSWWRVFGTGRPVVVVLRTETGLAGLLPLYLLDEAGCRKLLPLGVGASDYFDVLLDPEMPASSAAAMLRAGLDAGKAAGAEFCDLSELHPGAALRALLFYTGMPGETCPMLTIDAQAQTAEDAIPARQRRKLRMSRHRAARMGGASVTFAEPGNADAMLEALFRLNALRWGGLDADARRFHQAAAPALLEAQMLRLAQLRIGGAVAGCCYGLAAPGRLMFYLIGFDPGFANASPGTLLIGAMIDSAMAHGCREVHFLRGNEAYKYAWGAKDRYNENWRVPLAAAEFA